jgi:2-polyprenyl-6-methoxyphenol hydroxylase-like FAD-dependent oxidoreductase
MSHKLTQVLVSGAGPTGLITACELARRGVSVRVIEARPTPSAVPRAVLLWPPALRALDALGLGAAARAAGKPLARAVFHSDGRTVAPLDLAAHDAPLVLPQAETERLLTGLLRRSGVEVERGVRLAGLRQRDTTVSVRLCHAGGGESQAEARWLVGADGLRSAVRSGIGTPYPGVDFPTRYLLAEGALNGAAADRVDAHYYVSDAGIVGIIPLPGGRFRVSGGLPADAGALSERLVQRLLDERGPGGLSFGGASWLGEFAVHQRLADRFRVGRVFLAGEAAHVSPPLGGQGLTLGAEDARNLAWKLAEVIEQRADETLLDGYESERRAAAGRAVREARLNLRLWSLSDRRARAARDTALRLLHAAGLLGAVYEPFYSGRRLRHRPGTAVAASAGDPCSARARVLSRDGDGMRLSRGLHRLVVGADAGEAARETRMMLLTVFADFAPGLASGAARLAAEWPALLVHRQVPAAAMPPRTDGPRCREPGYYLVRPDDIVAVHRHGADLSAVAALLRSLTRG